MGKRGNGAAQTKVGQSIEQCSPHCHYLGVRWWPHHSYCSDNVPTYA